MKCPNCGFELPDNAKFCSACGTKIEQNNASLVTEDAASKQEEMSDYWIQNIKSETGVEFTIGGVKWSYDANLVTYNNFTRPFRQYEYEQRQLALDYFREYIREPEDLLSKGLDYAKMVKERSYKNALMELNKVGVSIEYDRLLSYGQQEDFAIQKDIEKIYSRWKEKRIEPYAARFKEFIINYCVISVFLVACDVIFSKGWMAQWYDKDEVNRLQDIAKKNKDNRKVREEVSYELLKVTPYIYAGYFLLFESCPQLCDEIVEMANYFGRAEEVTGYITELSIRRYPGCFYVSKKEDSILSIDNLIEYAADEKSALVAFKTQEFFEEKYKEKIVAHTLTFDKLKHIWDKAEKGNVYAKYLAYYLMFIST